MEEIFYFCVQMRAVIDNGRIPQNSSSFAVNTCSVEVSRLRHIE